MLAIVPVAHWKRDHTFGLPPEDSYCAKTSELQNAVLLDCFAPQNYIKWLCFLSYDVESGAKDLVVSFSLPAKLNLSHGVQIPLIQTK